jgi:putative ABC transport system permease protein
MSLGRLILAGLRQHPVMYGLNLLGLALGAALVVALILGASQLRSAATAEARGVDLVIGASGSPLQLVLSSVYHADAPTGNIPASQWMRWRAHPLVEEAVPLAMGDFVSGYRLVGTALSFAEFFHLSLVAGSWWDGEGAVVLGSSVARELSAGVGDALVASHGGEGPGAEVHHDHPLRVSGVLAPTGRVLDRLVLTDLRTYWHLHGTDGRHGTEGEMGRGSHGGDPHGHGSPGTPGSSDDGPAHLASADPGPADSAPAEYGPADLEGQEVTGLLVRYATPLAAGRLAREVSAQPRLQAASPAEEMARLLTVFRGLLWAAQALALLVLAVSALGLLVAIHQSLEQRRYEMALLRVLGAGRVRVGLLLVGEALLVGTGAALMGLLLGHLGVEVAARVGGGVAALPLSGIIWAPATLWVLPLAWLLGLLAAAPAAWRVFRMEVADVLARGG